MFASGTPGADQVKFRATPSASPATSAEARGAQEHAHLTTPAIARQLGSLFDDGSLVGLTDRQLIERFNHRRDEAAFAALVTRHGPMVLGVCRQLLGDRHHAEDAFQAAFLVLARKAHSIRDPDLLGTWLYGVALRTARKARAGWLANASTSRETSWTP